LVRFPEYSAGNWCVFFVHPANFTSAWRMYSTFLSLKERWFDSRNTNLIGISNEPVGQHEWSDKMRRYLGIYLKTPVIEDLDFSIATRYGMASRRRLHLPQFNRLGYIIDPAGIIRLIIQNPLPSIENAIIDLEHELDRLQGIISPPPPERPREVPEVSDVTSDYRPRPAYFSKKSLIRN
jgi:alkyl hydroperoxide reductase subunit AhpC